MLELGILITNPCLNIYIIPSNDYISWYSGQVGMNVDTFHLPFTSINTTVTPIVGFTAVKECTVEINGTEYKLKKHESMEHPYNFSSITLNGKEIKISRKKFGK